jgi:hypothetical protein
MTRPRIPFVGWFLSLSFAATFGALAYVAIFDQVISTATKTGTSYAVGTAAVVRGFIFLGVAIASLGLLATASRFRNLIWLGLALVWGACVLTYIVATS